jgi:uncharacterized cupin superfamily protein
MTLTLFKNHNAPRVQKDISEQIVEGQPVQHAELKFCGHGDKIKSGIWESTAGVFTADYNGIVEFCHILDGEASIKTADGAVFQVSAGDGFVLDSGLQTQWTVDKFVKKHFMICEL